MRNSITWDLFVEIALTHENVPSDRPIKKGRRRRGRGRGGSNNGTAYDVRSSTFIAYLCKTLSWKLASSIYSDANGLISKALKRGWNICFQPGLRNTRGSRALIKKLNGNARTLLRKFTFFFFFICLIDAFTFSQIYHKFDKFSLSFLDSWILLGGERFHPWFYIANFFYMKVWSFLFFKMSGERRKITSKYLLSLIRKVFF